MFFFAFCDTFRKILCVVCPQIFEKPQVCPDFKKFEKHWPGQISKSLYLLSLSLLQPKIAGTTAKFWAINELVMTKPWKNPANSRGLKSSKKQPEIVYITGISTPNHR